MTVGAISSNYRKLETPEEIADVAKQLDASWKDPVIPMRQWISVVRSEIERYRAGEHQRHFDVLIDAVKRCGLENPTLLDVGASSGFYSEILKLGGVTCRYTGLDYSSAYARMAEELYPGIDFHVADARQLPFEDASFDIVLSGCVLIHVADYEKVIAETARVAKQFAIFNRTPVTLLETTYFEKLAYGVPCLEIHFSHDELLVLFAKYNLEIVSAEDVFTYPEGGGHRTYLLKKS